MQDFPSCPKCNCAHTYQDGSLYICPECSFEWSQVVNDFNDNSIKDSNGNPLADGDSVTVIKDLKVRGSSSSIKQGTKVKSIRLVVDAVDGHNIDCKIDGFGAMTIKSEFVKKLS